MRHIWGMDDAKIGIAKDLIESGKLKSFEDIFLYVTKTDVAKKLGINYTRFRMLIKDPRKLRYRETYSLANIFNVSARAISELVHNQIERPKQQRSKK